MSCKKPRPRRSKRKAAYREAVAVHELARQGARKEVIAQTRAQGRSKKRWSSNCAIA